MWQPGWEGSWGRTDTCICVAEFFCCPSETITALLISNVVQVLSLSCWTLRRQTSLSFIISRSLLKLTLIISAVKSLQSCPTLCDPIDGSPPGSAVPGILQARTLEWVAISFSNTWKWKVKVKWLSRVRLFETPWTAAYQAPPSMGFSRQEYWSGLPLLSLNAKYYNINIYLYYTQWLSKVGPLKRYEQGKH